MGSANFTQQLEEYEQNLLNLTQIKGNHIAKFYVTLDQAKFYP